MDFNRVWLCGVAATEPILTKLPQSETSMAFFNLEVTEYFRGKDGSSRGRSSIFIIETLGSNASKTLNSVKVGKRYWVEGYLRQDVKRNKEFLKIRTYFVQEDSTYRSVNYKNGIHQALEILKMSRDIPAAIETLEGVLGQS